MTWLLATVVYFRSGQVVSVCDFHFVPQAEHSGHFWSKSCVRCIRCSSRRVSCGLKRLKEISLRSKGQSCFSLELLTELKSGFHTRRVQPIDGRVWSFIHCDSVVEGVYVHLSTVCVAVHLCAVSSNPSSCVWPQSRWCKHTTCRSACLAPQGHGCMASQQVCVYELVCVDQIIQQQKKT